EGKDQVQDGRGQVFRWFPYLSDWISAERGCATSPVVKSRHRFPGRVHWFLCRGGFRLRQPTHAVELLDLVPESKRTEDRFPGYLYTNMVRLWYGLFVPAVVCFGIGFVLVLVQTLRLPGAGFSLAPDFEGIVLAALLVAAVALPIVL